MEGGDPSVGFVLELVQDVVFLDGDGLAGELADVGEVVHVVPDVVLELYVLLEPLLHPLLSVNISSCLPTNEALVNDQLPQLLLLFPHLPFLIDHYPEEQPSESKNPKYRKGCCYYPHSS